MYGNKMHSILISLGSVYGHLNIFMRIVFITYDVKCCGKGQKSEPDYLFSHVCGELCNCSTQ